MVLFIGGENMEDKFYMLRTLELAKQAEGDTSPNPMVGCVLTDAAGTIIGEGYHHKAGQPHAEVMALRDMRSKGNEAKLHTAYVTLEPCSHYGRTGPCCKALAEAGVKRVVAAMEDPNPKVQGQGFLYLQEAGVEVITGVCQQEAEQLNEKFLWWITTGQPFVSLKYAMTLDGKIATETGDAKWVTGDTARRYGHYLRKSHDAILVGINTILADDAELTTRMVAGKNPVRIVLDSRARIPLTAKVLQAEAETIIVVGPDADAAKLAALAQLPHVQVWQQNQRGRLFLVSLPELLATMAQHNLTSVLVEGGSRIHGAFMDAGLYNKIYAFVAPKVLGGTKGLTPVGGAGHLLMQDSAQFTMEVPQMLGEDILLIARRRG